MPDMAPIEEKPKTTAQTVLGNIGIVVGQGIELLGEGLQVIPGFKGVGGMIQMSGLALEGVSGAPQALAAAQKDPMGQRVLRYGSLTLKLIGTGVAAFAGGPVGGAIAGTLLFGADIVDGGRLILKGEKTKKVQDTAFGAFNIMVAGTGIGLLATTLAFPPAAVFTVPALLGVGLAQMIGSVASGIAKFFAPPATQPLMPAQMTPVQKDNVTEKEEDFRHKPKHKPVHQPRVTVGFSEQAAPKKNAQRALVPTFPTPSAMHLQEHGQAPLAIQGTKKPLVERPGRYPRSGKLRS